MDVSKVDWKWAGNNNYIKDSVLYFDIETDGFLDSWGMNDS